MSSLNKKPEWRYEDGMATAGVSFLLTSIAFQYVSWKLQTPFTNDIVWANWPLLPKALLGCTLFTFGIETKSWIEISTMLNFFGYKPCLTWPITKFHKVRAGVELAEWIDQITVADVTDHVVQATVSSGKKRLIKKSKNSGDES